MSKKKNSNQNKGPQGNKKPIATPKKEQKAKAEKIWDEASGAGAGLSGFWANSTLHKWAIFLFAFLLYANAIPNGYAVDDSIVIERNEFTKKGMKGMKGIWTEDTFTGFFGGKRNLVSGGRYRPFTVAMFALENQIFGEVVTNKGQNPVVRNINTKAINKDRILKSLGNPEHKILKEYSDSISMNVTIVQGKPIPDKDGDINYQGNPQVSHAINGLFFALLCMLLYIWILQMFDPKKEGKFMAVFVAFSDAILFAAHPLHVEAVANIKGRDEIMVTLGSILATYWAMKSINNERWLLYMGGATLVFFMALFCKESAIPFLAIIPLALYFFTKADLTTIAIRTLPFVVAVGIFWVGIRNPILDLGSKGAPAPEFMNDPFMSLEDQTNGTRAYVSWDDKEKCPGCSSKKYGTIMYTWVEYLRLLAIPHPLTNDYYPKYIRAVETSKLETKGYTLEDVDGRKRFYKDNIPTLSSPKVLLSIFLHLGMAALALFGLLRRKPYAFALIFYAATFSVVSNLFFPIGTNMAERFMFMPSVGFSLICALGLVELAKLTNPKNKEGLQAHAMAVPLAVFIGVTALYSIKTFIRNFDWKSDYTLFTRDMAVSTTSAKLNNAVSGVLQEQVNKTESAIEKEQILIRALRHSKNAIELHPTYNNAWLLYGNANVMLGNIRDQGGKLDEALAFYNESIKAYNEVNRLRPDHADVPVNLTVAYRDLGKLLGQKMGRLPEAIQAFEASNKWAKGRDIEVLRLMGVAYGISNNHQKAIESFNQALAVLPDNAAVLFNLEVAYQQLAAMAANDPAKQQEYMTKALEYQQKWKAIDPNYDPRAGQ